MKHSPFGSPFDDEGQHPISPELEERIKKEMNVAAFAIVGTTGTLPCKEELRGEQCKPHNAALHVVGIEKKYLPGLLGQVAETMIEELDREKEEGEED